MLHLLRTIENSESVLHLNSNSAPKWIDNLDAEKEKFVSEFIITSESGASGYQFVTSFGIIYELYFTKFSKIYDKVQEIGLNPENFYYCGIEQYFEDRMPRGIDLSIKQNIALLMWMLFTDEPEAIIVFTLSNKDGRLKARSRKFRAWFNEFGPKQMYKWFQHDYDDKSICALYRLKPQQTQKKRQEFENSVIRLTSIEP